MSTHKIKLWKNKIIMKSWYKKYSNKVIGKLCCKSPFSIQSEASLRVLNIWKDDFLWIPHCCNATSGKSSGGDNSVSERPVGGIFPLSEKINVVEKSWTKPVFRPCSIWSMESAPSIVQRILDVICHFGRPGRIRNHNSNSKIYVKIVGFGSTLLKSALIIIITI